jgi:hypothetical protein
MMTGLDVTGSMYPYKYKSSSRQRGVKTGSGYKQYIQNHMHDGPLSEVDTELSCTCGFADLSFVAKPMSQPWTILQWLKTWLLYIAFPLGNTS